MTRLMREVGLSDQLIKLFSSKNLKQLGAYIYTHGLVLHRHSATAMKNQTTGWQLKMAIESFYLLLKDEPILHGNLA